MRQKEKQYPQQKVAPMTKNDSTESGEAQAQKDQTKPTG
jgi:hypothetical protein